MSRLNPNSYAPVISGENGHIGLSKLGPNDPLLNHYRATITGYVWVGRLNEQTAI